GGRRPARGIAGVSPVPSRNGSAAGDAPNDHRNQRRRHLRRRSRTADAKEWKQMTEKSTDNQNPTVAPRAFRIFLRVYGVLTLAIFVSLFIGFLAQSPLLAEHGGVLNWTIWNDVRCGGEHMHVPPMLMVIYIVWGRVPTAVGQKSPRLPVVSQLHHVGQPRP